MGASRTGLAYSLLIAAALLARSAEVGASPRPVVSAVEAHSAKRSWRSRIRLRLPTAVARLTTRALDRRMSNGGELGLWAGSSSTLGLAETTFIASKVTPLISATRHLGFAGAGGLTYSALRSIRQAKTVNDKMDAAGDLAWGVEGLLEFAPAIGGKLSWLSRGVGTLGGLCQTYVGARRIYKGVCQRDWGKVKLGALDVVSGGLWLAWDLFAIENPLVVGGFVGSMIGREAYANRKQLAAFCKRATKRVGRGLRAACREAGAWIHRRAPGGRSGGRPGGRTALGRIGSGL